MLTIEIGCAPILGVLIKLYLNCHISLQLTMKSYANRVYWLQWMRQFTLHPVWVLWKQRTAFAKESILFFNDMTQIDRYYDQPQSCLVVLAQHILISKQNSLSSPCHLNLPAAVGMVSNLVTVLLLFGDKQ